MYSKIIANNKLKIGTCISFLRNLLSVHFDTNVLKVSWNLQVQYVTFLYVNAHPFNIYNNIQVGYHCEGYGLS